MLGCEVLGNKMNEKEDELLEIYRNYFIEF